MEERIGQGVLDIPRFQEDLLAWFERRQRQLPWRENRDPYRVWVSEIMLQQTRVDTVIPYYNRFMERFPSLADLAEADLEDVYKLWEGLGYYSRARNLHCAVQEVKEIYGGIVPDCPEEIHKLKGVGPYTAGAILSIAYGLPEPAVDGNVMRVLSRIFLIREDIGKAKSRKLFEDLVRKIISRRNPSFFNQALMELGALVCSPKSPKCQVCPVSAYCQAREAGVQEELPVKKKGKQPRIVEMGVALLQDPKNKKWFICRRPSEGLLANLWEFPGTEFMQGQEDKEKLSTFLYQEFGLKTVPREPLLHYTHVFSHLQWNLHLYPCQLHGTEEHPQIVREWKWVTLNELWEYPFSASHKKIIEYINNDIFLISASEDA